MDDTTLSARLDKLAEIVGEHRAEAHEVKPVGRLTERGSDALQRARSGDPHARAAFAGQIETLGLGRRLDRNGFTEAALNRASKALEIVGYAGVAAIAYTGIKAASGAEGVIDPSQALGWLQTSAIGLGAMAAGHVGGDLLEGMAKRAERTERSLIFASESAATAETYHKIDAALPDQDGAPTIYCGGELDDGRSYAISRDRDGKIEVSVDAEVAWRGKPDGGSKCTAHGHAIGFDADEFASELAPLERDALEP